MKAYKPLLKENETNSITIKNLKEYEKGYVSNDISFILSYIIDHYDENDDAENFKDDTYNPELKKYYRMIINEYNKAINIYINKYFSHMYVNKKDLITRFLETMSSIEKQSPQTYKDFFPIIIYVADKQDPHKMTIGLRIELDGKINIFEGNDEATDKTYLLINKLLGSKPVKIYGMHTLNLINKIKETKIIPKGLYVSPNKQYASGHWRIGQDREMFSGIIDIADVRQESDVDWITIEDTEIKNVMTGI